MSYQSDREKFIVTINAEGLPVDAARLILRHANTLNRLALAQCNGDYPANNGQRQVKFCPECDSGFVPSSYKRGVCPDCAIQARIKEILIPHNIEPIFSGDPRGCVLKLKVPSGKTDDWGREGICVPSKER